MAGWVHSVNEQVLGNEAFRRVLYTGPQSQLVVMVLQPDEDIGVETHEVDQFLYVVSGEGRAVFDDSDSYIATGYGVFVPKGTQHNIVNTSSDAKLYLFTIYAPPEHPDGTVHSTKQEAEMQE